MLFCFFEICGAIHTYAQGDHAEPLGGSRWSPDSEWVALNWPGQPELFIISLKTGVSFTLRPSGDIQLDGGEVFATQAPAGGSDLLHSTRTVASFGRDRLTLLEWSPDSKQLAYLATPQTSAIFSILEESVKRRVASSEPLPWHKPDELRVTFEYHGSRAHMEEGYLMRVEKTDGTIVKLVTFSDLREIHLIPAIRSREVSFLAANGRFILYPRVVGSNGWQLVRESLAETNAVPQPVTKPSSTEPYQWQLSHDDRLLALVEGGALSIGTVDDWAHARTVSLPHESVLVRWSPDDRFLALLDERSLSVMGRDDDRPKLVTENCSPRFWGWRGTRLYFGNAVTDLTDLSYVDAEHLASPTRVSVRKREWESATREVSLSPDGTRLVCLVPEIDYAARTVWQLWERSLQQTNAEWQLMYEMKGK